MKKIGLIGGLTWYSSIYYYRYINHAINKKPGGDCEIPGFDTTLIHATAAAEFALS